MAADAKQLPPPSAAVHPPAAEKDTVELHFNVPPGREPTGVAYTRTITDGKWDDSAPKDWKLVTEKAPLKPDIALIKSQCELMRLCIKECDKKVGARIPVSPVELAIAICEILAAEGFLVGYKQKDEIFEVCWAPTTDHPAMKGAKVVEAPPAAPPKPAPPIEEPAPETYEVKHGPFSTRELALKKRDELMAHNGFPMLKTSHVTEGKIGKDFPVFYLQTVMRNRFPPPGTWKPNFVDDKEVPVAARAAAPVKVETVRNKTSSPLLGQVLTVAKEPEPPAAKEPEFPTVIAEALKRLQAMPTCSEVLAEHAASEKKKKAEHDANIIMFALHSVKEAGVAEVSIWDDAAALALLRISSSKGYIAYYQRSSWEESIDRVADKNTVCIIAIDEHTAKKELVRYARPKRFDPKQTAL